MANQMNFVNRGPRVKIVTVLPPIGDVQNGELFFLITDSKLYLRVTDGTDGWLASAALS